VNVTATAAVGLRDRVTSRARALPLEVVVAVLIFAAFCALVLVKSPQTLEPDDSAYRASIVALTHGHMVLTNAQYSALNRELAASGGQGIMQWHQLASGKWISEKNPGYPFFAMVFYLLGVLRVTPLFWGAIACLALFAGARRWLGRGGGVWAVALYCSSGAALVFAWRATMPTFTDASLIAAGAGGLLWAMLARDAAGRRRLVAGLLAMLAFAGAVFIRYTNVVELAVAIAAVLAARRAARLPWRTVAVWLGAVAVFAAALLAFNQLVYGGATATGYSAGEITFSPSAILPNLQHMPAHLLGSMPMLVLAVAALGWIVVRLARKGWTTDAAASSAARRDVLVAAALAAGWVAMWALYSAYTWTEQMGGQGASQTVHVIRFYVPVIGLIALLGAWLLSRLPKWLPPAVLATVVVLGVLSFQTMATQGIGMGAGQGGGPGGQGAPPDMRSAPGGSGGQQPPTGQPPSGQPPSGQPPSVG